MTRLRTFLAIEVDPAVRDRLLALQEKLAQTGAEVKWVEADNLHVTLLFLGEVEFRAVPAVCKAASAACAAFAPFTLAVERVGCFPDLRRPRVVWAGVGEGAEQVVAIHDALEPPLLELGCYRREERQYAPHITLGRVKSDCPTNLLAAALGKSAHWHGGETQVRQIHVMSSELTSDGPSYTVLGRARLAGSH